MLKKKITV